MFGKHCRKCNRSISEEQAGKRYVKDGWEAWGLCPHCGESWSIKQEPTEAGKSTSKRLYDWAERLEQIELNSDEAWIRGVSGIIQEMRDLALELMEREKTGKSDA